MWAIFSNALLVFEAFSASTRKVGSQKQCLVKLWLSAYFAWEAPSAFAKIERGFFALLNALFFYFYSFVAIFFRNLTHG